MHKTQTPARLPAGFRQPAPSEDRDLFDDGYREYEPEDIPVMAEKLIQECLPKDGTFTGETEKTIRISLEHRMSLRTLLRLYLILACFAAAGYFIWRLFSPDAAGSAGAILTCAEAGLAALFLLLGWVQPRVTTRIPIVVKETLTLTKEGAFVDRVQILDDDKDDPYAAEIEDLGIDPGYVSWLYTQPSIHGYHHHMDLKWADAMNLAEDAYVIYWAGPIHVHNGGGNLEDTDITDVAEFKIPKSLPAGSGD